MSSSLAYAYYPFNLFYIFKAASLNSGTSDISECDKTSGAFGVYGGGVKSGIGSGYGGPSISHSSNSFPSSSTFFFKHSLGGAS